MDKSSSEPNESPKDLSIGILGTELYETPAGESGQALVINSTRGEIPCLFHEAENEQLGIVWVGGARGGFTGPAGGIYKKFSDSLTSKGISSLRLHYRQPNNLEECVLDTLAGVGLLEFLGIKQIILIGHSFGGLISYKLTESDLNVMLLIMISMERVFSSGL